MVVARRLQWVDVGEMATCWSKAINFLLQDENPKDLIYSIVIILNNTVLIPSHKTEKHLKFECV